MILSFITLTSVLLLAAPSWAVLSTVEFERYIMPMCFRTDESGEPLVNGQEHPLAQTLENFIALAERYEAANPRKSLKEELFYFLRNYTYDNIDYAGMTISKWSPNQAKYDKVNELWEPDESLRKSLPDALDPFSDAEKCSIFNMMSHSVLLTGAEELQRAAVNKTRNSGEFKLAEAYPQEMGVVAVRGTNVGVALGKVLMGMYVGMHSNRKRPITDYNTKDKDFTNTDFNNKEVDPLYILTLADMITIATWIQDKTRYGLAGDGQWVSSMTDNKLDTKDVCPMIYKLDKDTKSAFSYSYARGAADGFILGLISESISSRKTNARLSQILRMYYSRSGISGEDSQTKTQMRASFCNRLSMLQPFEETLKDQVLVHELLVSPGFTNNVEVAYKYYIQKRDAMFGLGMGEIKEYCGSSFTIDRPEDLPLESPLDVIALIDTSSDTSILKPNTLRQQLILGYLAKQMALSYSNSRITVLTNQKVSADANGKIQLVSIASDNPSAACVACSVTQFVADGTPVAPEDEVIIALDQLLQAKKENETKQHGVSGKVVIYFNLKEDNNVPPQNSQTQRRVDTALRDLHLRHQDTAMYALGKTGESVKKFARDDVAFVMSAIDEAENIIGKKLFEKISKAPATLQYSSCEDGKGEKSAVYEDFVSPNSIQHWEMPAKYFLKSKDYKFRFESPNGPVRVCHSRATSSPELQKSTCKDVTNSQPAEFINSNPCKGFNVISCAPFYFSIMGINNTATDAKQQDWCDDTNSENQCRTLDQIKFKVSHEGIRCSGSIGLVSTPLLLVVGIFLLNIFTKKY